jgi:hypothetical protein
VLTPKLFKLLEIVKEYSPKGYELWSGLPMFDWGPRPVELIGKTSMGAVWIETDNSYYYGETSLADSNVFHGKGIIIFKEEPNQMFECWWNNNKRNGRGRMIKKDGHMYEGEFLYNKRHGEGVYTYPDGE